MLSLEQQIKIQIEKSEHILIFCPQNAPDDVIVSCWGAFHLLKALGKKCSLFTNGQPQKDFSFLATPDEQITAIEGARDFIISFGTERSGILKVTTRNQDGKFEILVTPEKETIDPRDFSIVPAKFKYDLLLVIGSPDLDSLGSVREKNPDLFFEVPIMNIDVSSTNEQFGQINHINVSASCVAEILASLARLHWEKFMNPQIADCLLASLTIATSNFQERNTSPKSFLTASWLIEKGADQQKIVRRLLKTNSFSFMKLWGRVMARLSLDEKKGLAWSTVTLEDFVQSRSQPADLFLVLSKIKENYSRAKFFAILYSERIEKTIGIFTNTSPEALNKIKDKLGGEIKNGYLEIAFENKNILEAEKEMLSKIEALLKKT